MQSDEVHPPTPMTPEMRRALVERARTTFEDERFMYGDNWFGTAAFYRQKLPGFSEQECETLALFSAGVRAKEHRALMKKNKRKIK